MLPEWYKYFNYGSIVIIAALLVVVLIMQLERDQYIFMLYAAIALLVLRVIFRIYFYMKSKKVNEE
jgi:L-asparagine transporter-like permease